MVWVFYYPDPNKVLQWDVQTLPLTMHYRGEKWGKNGRILTPSELHITSSASEVIRHAGAIQIRLLLLLLLLLGFQTTVQIFVKIEWQS